MGIRRYIYNLYQLSQGNHVFKSLQNLEKSQWYSSSEIESIQWIKLNKIINYAYQNVPYYKEQFELCGLIPDHIRCKEDIQKLPLLTKADIESNIDGLISVKYKQDDLIKYSTGGSTGRNLRFYLDKNRLPFRQAVAIRGNLFAGLDICDKHAYLWGSPFDLSIQKKYLNTIVNFISGRCLFLSSYDLSETKMFEYAVLLKKYRPEVLVSYPTPLYVFSQFINKNNIDLKFNSIISSSEVLYDYQRSFIEDVFGCTIFNRYGCREFGMIAMECSEHSGLHINSEHVYLEVLNESGEPAKPGDKGELVITDLDNYGMPFIRYKIGDLGVLSNKKCKCGRNLPLLETVVGRTFDIVVGTNGNQLGGTFWTHLFRNMVRGIVQFQVVQESIDTLNISITINEEFQIDYINILSNKIKEYCGCDMNVNFEIVDKILLTKSGKFNFVISKCSPFVDNRS